MIAPVEMLRILPPAENAETRRMDFFIVERAEGAESAKDSSPPAGDAETRRVFLYCGGRRDAEIIFYISQRKFGSTEGMRV
jgi:hypothetical protein